jgi:Family of unknown function (DUF6760)
MGYPVEQIYREVAYIAYYFHWPLAEILDLDHAERRRWCREISRINEEANAHDGTEETRRNVLDV